jgi:cyclase
MSRTLLVRLSAVAIALGCAWVAYTQAPQGKDGKQQAKQASNKLNKITDDLYEIEGDGGNVAVYITNEGVIVVDDKFEYDFNDIMAKIKSVTAQPVKYVLNTHHHGDHTGSNEHFLSTAEIISTANARKNMVNGKQPGAPRVVFTDETDVFLGGKQVQMRYFGRGHTNGDAMVYFPALRILHTGDLMAGASPLIDYSGGGSLKEWAATLDGAMKLDFDTVIPGHGPIAKKADMLTYRNNVEKLRMEVTDMLRQNKSRDDIAKVVQDKYGWAPTGLQFQVGFDGMLAELKR